MHLKVWTMKPTNSISDICWNWVHQSSHSWFSPDLYLVLVVVLERVLASWVLSTSACSPVHFIWLTTPLFLWGQHTLCIKITDCFHGPAGVPFVRPYLVEHSSSSATALITDTQTVQVFAQGVTVCVTVTARTLVTVLCYLCILKCLFIIIIIILLSLVPTDLERNSGKVICAVECEPSYWHVYCCVIMKSRSRGKACSSRWTCCCSAH